MLLSWLEGCRIYKNLAQAQSEAILVREVDIFCIDAKDKIVMVVDQADQRKINTNLIQHYFQILLVQINIFCLDEELEMNLF